MCRWIARIFALLYLLALAIFVIGLLGLFGQPRDPLGGVFLIPLGLPWNAAVDALPEPTWPWAMAAAPLINLLIIQMICRWRRS